MKPDVILLNPVPYMDNEANQLTTEYGYSLLSMVNGRIYAFKNWEIYVNFLNLFNNKTI